MRFTYKLLISLMGLAIFISIIIQYYIPDFFGGFTVEIIGTTLGFIFGILFSDMYRKYEKQERKEDILTNIISEVATFYEFFNDFFNQPDKLETELYPFRIVSMDMWEMAKSSGDLILLDSFIRGRLNLFFSYIRNYNVRFQVWLTLDPASRIIQAKQYSIFIDFVLLAFKEARFILDKLAPQKLDFVPNEP